MKQNKKLKYLNGIWSFLILVLVVGFFLYDNVRSANKAKDSFTINNYHENPQKYGGEKIEVLGRLVNISQNYFYFDIGSKNLEVYGSGVRKPILGETVVFLNFRKDGVIELIDFHNYNYNYLLYGVSIFALLIFGVIFFMEWKITLRGFKDA